MKSAVTLLFRPAAAAAIVAATFVSLTWGQDRIREADRRLRERQERALILKQLDGLAHTPEKQREAQLSVAQISVDFSRIQSANNELVEPLIGGSPLDFKTIAKSAAEIRKRAVRLRENLGLPTPEKTAERFRAEDCAGPEQLKSSITTLSHVIVSFVTNPIFQQANVVDTRLSSKARVDLDQIIELSEAVRRGGERLSKDAKAAH